MPNRTSPVVRGKWLLENILGAPPPPPPPNVPALRENDEKARSRRRCASGWSSTARTRSARAVTRGWIRWASRSRTSTRSAGGGPIERRRTRHRRVRRAARRHEASTGRRSSAQALLTHRDEFVGTLDREAADLRARPRRRVLRHAGGARRFVRARAANDYRWSAMICAASSRARRFRCASSRQQAARQRRCEGAAMHDHHQKASVAAHHPARPRRDARAAAAGRHGARRSRR